MKTLIRYTLEDLYNWAYETWWNLRDWFLGLDVRIEQRADSSDFQIPPVCGNERLAEVVLTQLARVAPGQILIPVDLFEDLVDGVKAMKDRPPESRVEWMAKDLVEAVSGNHSHRGARMNRDEHAATADTDPAQPEVDKCRSKGCGHPKRVHNGRFCCATNERGAPLHCSCPVYRAPFPPRTDPAQEET